MFAFKLRRIYCVCDKVLTRSIRGNRLEKLGANPGLDHRIKAFRKEGVQIVDNYAEEFVEQSESDFYKVGEVYNEHVNETLLGKLELKHHIIKDKYFKENMPNLLTWSEKEQIRHLANQHPDEWTPERIAESFPVTAPVVKKLLKYPWKPASEMRISRHDASAMRNWRELEEGTLDIPENMRKHFLKFSNRTIPPLKKESIKIDVTPETMGEYEQIVRRCAAKNKTDEKIENDPSNKETNDFIPKPPAAKKDSKRMTLEELSSKIQMRLKTGEGVDMPDQILIETINAKPAEGPVQLNTEVELYNDTKNEIAQPKGNDDTKSIMEYPERIRIPKKSYKKGATYKVDDCYYDHDGKFLYRVLGMTNN